MDALDPSVGKRELAPPGSAPLFLRLTLQVELFHHGDEY
jgi:hypothetical protein